MPNYCINKNAQPNGDHEVHDTTPGRCNHLPDLQNQIDVGFHLRCHEAVAAAKKRWPEHNATINGCYYCSNECHTT